MGDYCYTRVTVRKEDFGRIVESRFGGDSEKFLDHIGANDAFFDDHTVDLAVDEANYAEWDELEEILKEERIEYNKDNGDGYDMESGTTYYRINDKGEIEEVVFVDEGNEEWAQFLKHLMSLPSAEEVDKAIWEKYRSIYPVEIKPLVEARDETAP